jgi:hypothetical protein
MKIKYPILILFPVLITILFGCADTSADEETAAPGAIQLSGPIGAEELNGTYDETETVYSNNYELFLNMDGGGGSPRTITITIANTGEGDLTLTNLPLATTGTNADQFIIEEQPISLIATNTETTFKLKYTNFNAEDEAQLDIESDDPDLANFTLALTGFYS